MRFIKDYFSDDTLRQELNDLTKKTFYFDFEKWYHADHVGGYIPYAFEEDGRLLANASANIMQFMQSGQVKNYIQIGTVVTAEECRNRGYARELITKIIEDYQGKVDGFYLFGNLSALGFYDKIGFQRGLEYRCCIKEKVERLPSDGLFEKVDSENAEMREYYRSVVREAAVNAELDQINRYGLQMFYTADMEQVYYSKELDCFICLESEDEVLHLNSIICKHRVNLKDVLERIPVDYQKLIFGFTPLSGDAELCVREEYDGEDDYRLFYIGEAIETIKKDKLIFPEYSHA